MLVYFYFIFWASLKQQVGQFWSTGYMFDTPVLHMLYILYKCSSQCSVTYDRCRKSIQPHDNFSTFLVAISNKEKKCIFLIWSHTFLCKKMCVVWTNYIDIMRISEEEEKKSSVLIFSDPVLVIIFSHEQPNP